MPELNSFLNGNIIFKLHILFKILSLLQNTPINLHLLFEYSQNLTNSFVFPLLLKIIIISFFLGYHSHHEINS